MTLKTKDKSFKEWQYEEVSDEFGLTRRGRCRFWKASKP